MDTTNRLEGSYLRHILNAVQVKDYSAPFRTFFDNWFAFKEGGPFLNGRSRPHWFNNPCPDRHGQALARAHFISIAAARTLAGLDRVRLMKDHAIPVAVLRDMLFEEQPTSMEEVGAFMLRHYRFGIITGEEDRKLNAAGLQSCMPDGWTTTDGQFARYAKIGIVAQDQGSRRASAAMSEVVMGRDPGRFRIGDLLNSTASGYRARVRGNG